jgi:hypothetical protein
VPAIKKRVNSAIITNIIIIISSLNSNDASVKSIKNKENMQMIALSIKALPQTFKKKVRIFFFLKI